MNRWPKRPLGEAYWFQEGPGVRKWQFRNSGVKLLNVANITKDGVLDLSKSDRHLSEEEVSEKYSHFLADAGDLVIASSGISFDEDGQLRTRGAFVEPKHLPLCLNTSTIRFKPEEGVSTLAWLRYWLDSSEFREQITRLVTGSAQQNFRPSHLKATEITLPPLAEQERIVKLLDEADELRKLRAQADRRTAALIPALFHDMFGDAAVNPKRWPKRRLRELGIRFSDGPFGSNLKSSHYAPEGVRVIRLQNIGVGRLVDNDRAYISPEHFDSLRKHECLPGDVLVGTLGDPNLRACILPPDIPQALNKADCVQIRPNPEIAMAEFICWLLNLPSTLEMAAGMILGQTRARISMGRLAELLVPLPPLPLQQEFAQRVTEIRALEAAQAASRLRLEALFQSMLHRAFNEDL